VAPAPTAGRPLALAYRFGLVLGLLVLLITFALAAPEGAGKRFAMVVLHALTLLAAAWAGQARARLRRAAGVLAGICVATAAAGAAGVGWAEGAAVVATALLVLATPLVMVDGLGRLLRERGVTLQGIIGAIGIYLLLGTFCASVYGGLAELAGPALFADGRGDGTVADRYYFSFITQATVGYGDFTPAAAGARVVAVWQAVAGQLYLVTVIALLVGRVGRRRPEPGANRSAEYQPE
jgi:hypothetical protein